MRSKWTWIQYFQSLTVSLLLMSAAGLRAQDNNPKALGELSRAIVGFEQAGASSSKSAQNFFFDLDVSIPLAFRHPSAAKVAEESNKEKQKDVDPYFGPRLRSWGEIRVTSVPQQIHTSVGGFAASFAQQAANVPVNEVAQAAEFLAGVQYRIGETAKAKSYFGFGHDTTQKFAVSLLAAGGAITPTTPRQSLEVFQVPTFDQSFFTKFPQATGKQFIAFVLADRDRFFRQYYAGFRFETYYFDLKGEEIKLRFPATLDITYGVNEAVTGGRVHGGVIRLEGFYPLPFQTAQFVYLFGTALIKPARARIVEPLILQPAPADTPVPAANVALVTIPQINRDYYRIGVGIDFISFYKCGIKKQCDQETKNP